MWVVERFDVHCDNKIVKNEFMYVRSCVMYLYKDLKKKKVFTLLILVNKYFRTCFRTLVEVTKIYSNNNLLNIILKN